MATEQGLKRYRKNFLSEREAGALYNCLAALEENPAIADVYRRLARTEATIRIIKDRGP